MNEHILLIQRSLELCANLAGDINETVYQRFYQRSPDAEPLMAHTDQYMRGRMLDGVFKLLMEGIASDEGDYLHWEVENHINAYGVGTAMYRPLLQAVMDTVREALADQWNAEFQSAWELEINQLVERAQHHAATLGKHPVAG